jgi:tRNA(Ile)-lysidine synthase
MDGQVFCTSSGNYSTMKTMAELRDKVQKQIREQRLLVPGDRVAMGVSGGADSVALLRLLLELREALGIVLSVAHFHHQIRGAEADADQQFVRELAEKYQLEFYSGLADVPAHARERKLSLESAARELRHGWFAGLVAGGCTDKIATAHTLDDQAETVLMRILRGTGARGLAGIAPEHKEKHLIRPLLGATRNEIEEYLNEIQQTWRNDSSNQDLHHTRNRLRHTLLPLLESEFNPAIRQTLADLAEVARAEDEYWRNELASLLPRIVREGKPTRSGRSASGNASDTLALELSALRSLPQAVQRLVLLQTAAQLGAVLEFKHIQQLAELIHCPQSVGAVSLPGNLQAECSLRELRFSLKPPEVPQCYGYPLAIPGEVHIPELGKTIRARVLTALPTQAQNRGGNGESLSIHAQERRANGEPLKPTISGYNMDSLLSRTLLAPQLTVRNWRTGDRFFPAHSHSPKKVKELLQSSRLGVQLSSGERKLWPVIESAGEIVWMRGFPVPQAFMAQRGEAVLIEEITDLPIHAQNRRANGDPLPEDEGAK